MSWRVGLLVLAMAGAAQADDGDKPLRLLGEMRGAGDGAPTRFVIDGALSQIYGNEVRASGWLAVLSPTGGGDDLEGACVAGRCALSAYVAPGKLTITGDYGDGVSGPLKATYAYEPDGEDVRKGEVTLTPLTDTVPGLGRLVAPSSLTEGEFDDLLAWVGFSPGFTNADGTDRAGTREQSAFADWQRAKELAGGGLIVAEQLAQLRAEAAAAQAAAGWTPLGAGEGWSGGYPKALMPVAKPSGASLRFESPDSRAVLILAREPALSDEAWDALVETRTNAKLNDLGYTRVNDDMELTYSEAGDTVTEVYHRRPGAVAHMTFRYPPVEDERYAPIGQVLTGGFRAGPDLKAP